MTDEPNTVYPPQPNQTANPASPPAGLPSPAPKQEASPYAPPTPFGSPAPIGQPHPRDYPEEPKVKPIPSQAEIKTKDDATPEKIDHFKEIAELVSGLAETSPSGANTIGQKIMYHVNALANPAEFDKEQAEKHKIEKKQAHEDAEKLKKYKADQKAARKAAREEAA